jgi:CXXX repeat modification system protein
MIKKIIGKVTVEERDEIQALFERKNGLAELSTTLSSSGAEIQDELYEKVVKDMGSTSTKFKLWWEKKSSEYSWENVPGGNWEINFETCEIILVT